LANILSKPKADILIIDDTPDNLRLLNQILSQYYKVRLAPSGVIGLKAALSAPPDLILLDIMMPGMDGFEVAAKLKAAEETKEIPILFISALDDTESKVRGFKAGAVDYVTKPFQEMEVLARVKTHMELRAMYRQAQAEIEERKQIEKELRQSEARNRALLSAVPDMMYRIRRDGVFLDFKASVPALLFAPPDQIIGASLSTIIHEPLLAKFMACIEQTLLSKEIQELEYKLKFGDSSHVFEARFKDSGPDEVTLIVRDVSERARLEEMKSDFINRATHELRTPITTMLLMINLIDSGTTLEEYQEYWEVLKSEVYRERMLIEDLLNVGRLESGRLQLNYSSFDIIDLLNRVIHQFELPARDQNIIIAFQALPGIGDTGPLVCGDENALTQVFVNLLGNAIKFSPAGGNVTVCLAKKDPGFEISFIDTGIGIPSDDLPLLFTRFFRGSNAIKEEIPGTGIGLFIVRSIIEKHGGKIDVHSELGKGSQFTVWLP
jgi:PAS domain S-box-containing protein